MDGPGLDARVVVISFLPELVYNLGSSSHDFAFLLPFYTQVENQPYVLRATDAAAAEASLGVAKLLREFFSIPAAPHREAACKARLLDLLLVILRRFQGCRGVALGIRAPPTTRATFQQADRSPPGSQ
jgi:hypothetical protein